MQFLLAWIGLFFAGAVMVFFAGSARYLLPMAAPVALLASRQAPRWLALGFALQLALSLGLADRELRRIGPPTGRLRQRSSEIGERRRVVGGWRMGASLLPGAGRRAPAHEDSKVAARRTLWFRVRWGMPVTVTDPADHILQVGIRSAIPLRIVGLETHSAFLRRVGWSLAFRRVERVDRSRNGIGDRRAACHSRILPMDAAEAREQIVSGIYADHWMGGSAIVAIKSPSESRKLRLAFYLPNASASASRHITLTLDGGQVASETYTEPGAHVLESSLVSRAGSTATVEITVTPTFHSPGDARDLGVVVTSVGFVP